MCQLALVLTQFLTHYILYRAAQLLQEMESGARCHRLPKRDLPHILDSRRENNNLQLAFRHFRT